MTCEALIAKLREIERTGDFQNPIDAKEMRIRRVEDVFQLGRMHMKQIGRLAPEAIEAMETGIEVLFRCRDFEVLKYTTLYRTLSDHDNLIKNKILSYN